METPPPDLLSLNHQSVRDAMRRLEDQSDDPRDEVPVGEALAKILRVVHTVSFEEQLGFEITRACSLLALEHLRGRELEGQGGADAVGIGFLQGATYAAAIERVRKSGRRQ